MCVVVFINLDCHLFIIIICLIFHPALQLPLSSLEMYRPPIYEDSYSYYLQLLLEPLTSYALFSKYSSTSTLTTFCLLLSTKTNFLHPFSFSTFFLIFNTTYPFLSLHVGDKICSPSFIAPS